ncbi:MAG: hypothetical protein M3203_04230 [Actinomycetota bacterium]|nr:hypothetical protein [Actinomycetota bacterium]
MAKLRARVIPAALIALRRRGTAILTAFGSALARRRYDPRRSSPHGSG